MRFFKWSKSGKFIGVWVIFTFIISATTAVASDPKPINWREAFVTVESILKPVEGHEGHTVGVMHQRGFAFYEDGEVATVQTWLTFERSGPETSYRGYAIYSFLDGTTKVGRFNGSGDPRGQQSGKFTFEGGTERYQGISGEGSFSGRGFPPHGDIYLDVTGTYSLP